MMYTIFLSYSRFPTPDFRLPKTQHKDPQAIKNCYSFNIKDFD
ncbi:hypothetical protein [Moorena sp. SIO4A5]|nr:hypothetical protein [Moorena sp. SIO4A5]